MSVLSLKAKPKNLLNSAAKSRSPEPLKVELFWEPWHYLEIPTLATRFKAPLNKSKDSLETPEILISDRGYKGQKEFGKTRLLTPSVSLKTDSQ